MSWSRSWTTAQSFFARKKQTNSLTSLMSAYKSVVIKWAFISVIRATSINKINNKWWFGSSTSSKRFFVYPIPCRIGILKCWFLRRGENQSTRRKTNNKLNPHMTVTPGFELGPNRRFAWWRHFTNITRIFFVFSFIFKFGYPSED